MYVARLGKLMNAGPNQMLTWVDGLRRYLTSMVVLAVLVISLLATRLGPAQAQAPTPLVTITGTVMPGESQEHPFTIPQDLGGRPTCQIIRCELTVSYGEKR